MSKYIHLCLAHMSGRELDYIQEAFNTNWVVPLGPNVDAFETLLEDYIDPEHHAKVAALSSGTAALHVALNILGIGKGDEVMVQSFTFCASANPVLYRGATPVFVDSEPETWNIDPDLLDNAIADRIRKTGRKPKAIIPVTLYGMPYRVDRLLRVAAKYDIPVVEDSAEGLGSCFKGRKMGTFGTFGVLSFNGNKMITTSGGGALICRPDDEAKAIEMKKRALYLATQARQPRPYYHHTEMGYNYRMSNICAGIGRGQMTVLDEHIRHHRHVHRLYAEWLRTTDGVNVMSAPDASYESNYWLTTVTLSDTHPDTLRLALEARGIESRPLWKPLHLQPLFRDCPAYVNGVSESLFAKGLCLPSGPLVTDEDVAYIVHHIQDILQG